MGDLGFTKPGQVTALEYSASLKVTTPLDKQIVSQAYQPPDEAVITTLQHIVRKENETLQAKLEEVKDSLTQNTKRTLNLATE